MKRVQVDPSVVQIISPVPDEWWPRIWMWMDEFPDNNRDDDGPQDWHALAEARADSAMEGERTFGVLVNGLPVGYLSYAPLNARVAITRGIVFTQAVYGTGVARIAAEQVLCDVFASGIRKLQATYYTHNIRVAAWLRALGAVEEGCLRDQVLQHGRPVSLKVVAIFAPEEPCH